MNAFERESNLDWSYSMTERDIDEWAERLLKTPTFIKEDLKKFGINVQYDINKIPYIDTPYGKCYLKDLPFYKKETNNAKGDGKKT